MSSPHRADVTESSGLRQELCPTPAVHPMHSQPGMFAIHTKLLTVIVIQDPGSCNMTTSLVADDPHAYMFVTCSPGYYGPLCSLLHTALPGEPCYGRTGTFSRQNAGVSQASPALTCAVLHHVVFCLELVSPCPCCSHPVVQFCFAPSAMMGSVLLVYIKQLT